MDFNTKVFLIFLFLQSKDMQVEWFLANFMMFPLSVCKGVSTATKGTRYGGWAFTIFTYIYAFLQFYHNFRKISWERAPEPPIPPFQSLIFCPKRGHLVSKDFFLLLDILPSKEALYNYIFSLHFNFFLQFSKKKKKKLF